jgi:hypothetical protein
VITRKFKVLASKGGFGLSRTIALWATSVLTLLLCGFAGKLYFPAKRVGTKAAPRVEFSAPALKAATPEDPGEASVVGPLAVWMRESDAAKEQQSSAAFEVPQTSIAPQKMDHVFAAPADPERYLSATFPLKKAAQFTFVIPPHTVSPRLKGSFRSFVKHTGDDPSGQPADIDLVLMNAQQFDDFVHHRSAEATFELESSSSRTVEFLLPSAHDQPQEYHLVFRDHSIRTNLFVKADFVVNAD